MNRENSIRVYIPARTALVLIPRSVAQKHGIELNELTIAQQQEQQKKTEEIKEAPKNEEVKKEEVINKDLLENITHQEIRQST